LRDGNWSGTHAHIAHPAPRRASASRFVQTLYDADANGISAFQLGASTPFPPIRQIHFF
jgi:hypothetical protein